MVNPVQPSGSAGAGAGRDNTHQLPTINSTDSASMIIPCTIPKLVGSPSATPISLPVSAVPYSAAGTSNARTHPGISAPSAADPADPRQKDDRSARKVLIATPLIVKPKVSE